MIRTENLKLLIRKTKKKARKKIALPLLFKLLTILFLLHPAITYCNTKIPVTPISTNNKAVAIQQWLVAGEFPSEYKLSVPNNNGRRFGYSTDFLKTIGGESKARIKEGTTVGAAGYNVVFTAHEWENPYIDLLKIFGESSKTCAYLYTEVESGTKQEVFFHVGINDAGKVWVGGKLIIEHPIDGAAEQSQHIEKVLLKKGRTSVLVKIDQAAANWGAFVEVYGVDANREYIKKHEALDFGKYIGEKNSIATHIETKVLWKKGNRYIGWPTITKTKSNELLAVFSGNRDDHVCPYGIDQMIRSTDNGKTWSQPETINNTPLDDRDPGILETNQGTLLINWFTSLAFDNPDYYKAHPEWIRHTEKISNETKQKWIGNWTRRSTNGGKSWETPVRQTLSSPHGAIQLLDNRLICIGTGNIDGQKILGAEESQDDGKSWNIISTFEIPDNCSIEHFSEPHVVEASAGKLIAMFRYNPTKKSECYLYQSESIDGGKSWSMIHKTPIWGYPPHLIKLKNGWLLAVYGVRRKPYSERACFSKDGGKTWDIKNEIILNKAINADLGYPASVQLNNGSILTIYYQIDKPGEKTCLMSTHWKLKSLK